MLIHGKKIIKNKMTDFDKKIEEIISVLNEHDFKLNFRLGADELIYHKDNYNGYIVLGVTNDTLSVINVKDKIEEIKNSIKNISDNKESLITLLKKI